MFVLRGVLKTHPSGCLVRAGRELRTSVHDQEFLPAAAIDPYVAWLNLGRGGGEVGRKEGREGECCVADRFLDACAIPPALPLSRPYLLFLRNHVSKHGAFIL